MKGLNTAAILAGGRSSRMGFDKQTLSFDKNRLMDGTIHTLKKAFSEILVVTNRFELYDPAQVTLLGDEIPGQGPLGGLHAALKKSTGGYIYLVACDMPVIPLDYIRYLKERMEEGDYDACVTRKGQWVEPFHGFYSKSLLPPIEKGLEEGRLSLAALLRQVDCLYIEEEEARRFSSDWSMFSNVNTPEDLARWLKPSGDLTGDS